MSTTNIRPFWHAWAVTIRIVFTLKNFKKIKRGGKENIQKKEMFVIPIENVQLKLHFLKIATIVLFKIKAVFTRATSAELCSQATLLQWEIFY